MNCENMMTTVQVGEETKRHLFSIAAELQSKRGRKTSLEDAIRHLINVYHAGKRDIPGMLSLFGCVTQTHEARRLLRELRGREEQELERVERKHRA